MIARRLLLTLGIGVVAFAIGCGGSDDLEVVQPGNSPDPDATGGQVGAHGTIGYSAMTLKNPFFSIIAEELTKEAEAHGFTVVVNDADDKLENQAKHIDSYIQQGVSAIVLNPVDRIAIGDVIKKANAAGIPVFTCDLECEAEGIEIAGHVGTDNFQGGQLAGKAMIEALGSEGGEVLILALPEKNSCVLRVNGFKHVIDEHNETAEEGSKIKIVAELPCGGLRDPGFKATNDSLQQHPNIRGIFAINDPSALGAWQALDQNKKTDQVTLIGFDGQNEGKVAIKEGKIYADPIQFPDVMGKMTAENIAKYFNGEGFESHVLLETKLYTKADADADESLATPAE
ncbi:MAG: substrate-binding domain-containing protein [Planctomycetaceae bacterium]